MYDRHAATIHRYLRRRVGPDDSEDLLTDTFLIAFRRRTTYDQARKSALPWLYGIAANLVLKHHRELGRRSRAFDRLATMDATEASFELDLVDHHADASEVRRLLAVVNELPPSDREVLVLYAWEGLSYQDIAAALDIPVGTVRSRLNRVRKNLRAERGSDSTKHAHNQRQVMGEALP